MKADKIKNKKKIMKKNLKRIILRGAAIIAIVLSLAVSNPFICGLLLLVPILYLIAPEEQDFSSESAEYRITRPYYILKEDVYLEGFNLTFHKGSKFYLTTTSESYPNLKITNEEIFIHECLTIHSEKFALAISYKDKMEFYPTITIETIL